MELMGRLIMTWKLVMAFLTGVMLPVMFFHDDDSANLMNEVRFAWQSNGERLGRIEAVFEKVVHLPHSNKMTTYEVTLRFTRGKFLIRQESVASPGHYFDWFFDGKNWIEYRSKQGVVIKRLPDQMPGAYPFDFREAFMHDVKSPFLDCVSRMQFSRTHIGETSLINAEFKAEDETSLSITFDPIYSHLPTSSVHSLSNGNALRRVDMQYDYVSQRRGYLPSLVTIRLFEAPAFIDASSVTTLRLKHLKLGEPQADLTFEFPAKSRVYDMTSDRTDR